MFSESKRDFRVFCSLILHDLKARYLTNYLGIFWIFVQPCVTAFILWLVFQHGFKVTPLNDYPFVLWLVCGLVPWFFVAEGLSAGCLAIKDNSFLVKKIVFNVSLLPAVKLTSALVVHIVFLFILLGLFMVHGYTPSLHWLQVIYCSTCLFTLLMGLAWTSSSITLFFPDLTHIIAMITQLGFWLTPVFWDITAVDESYKPYFDLNPFTYIVEGFRNSLIRGVWFWEQPVQTIQFWGVVTVLGLIGHQVFKKLRPHFADVM